MDHGFDLEMLNRLGKLIGTLERFQLEGSVPEEFEPADLFEEKEQVFFRIQGLADFWSHQAGSDFAQHMVDFVIGAHNQQQADLMLVMLGTPQNLSVFLSLGEEKTTRTILEGMFPGIVLETVAVQELPRLLPEHFLTKGLLTGIPSRKAFGMDGAGELQNQRESRAGQPGKQDKSQLERIIRGMHGSTWAYMVQAYPRPRPKVVAERMKTVDLLTQVASRSRVQWQSTKQDSQQITTTESGSNTQTYSGDMVNYRAQYLNKLLERELERLDQAAAAGQWTVRAYFGAGNAADAQRLASLLLGTLAGTDSRPEPLRAFLCQKQGAFLENYQTFLTSNELAMLIQLPREEAPGYALHDYVQFDVDFRAPASMNVPLGHIQQNGRNTHDTFNISVDALTKHAVVVGVTGSGKTTTVMSLLDRVVEARRPFLVIEPAKTEYRSLRGALASRVPLRVYTLGNEMVAPFRLNPFEFETDDDPANISLLTHIDFLKAVFNAAFPLYAPMPQVLEEALHEVYEDKGWELASGTNRRLPNWLERQNYPIFPTLTDLYNKVEIVTNRLGYHKEVESNVKAALKTRIGSLRIGSKGLMLDTARGIPMRELLATPVILELENIGNDDEKTFLMGLFLAKLYEYRRLQAATGTLPSGLQHLIVFEEAHRLLKNTETQVSSEGSNLRAQAIEVFTNMLSEVRAYGQGVLVAEQIPSKLAPDVLKNTNLKIVHRLIAQDDRQSIGQTMNLNGEQQIHLGVLDPGKAAVYAEGADHAYLVRLENYKQKLSPLVDEQLKQASHEYASVKAFQEVIDIEEYGVPLSPSGGPDPALYQAAGRLLDSAKSQWLWANILLRLAANVGALNEILTRFSEQIEAEMPYLLPDQHDTMLQMLLIRGSAETMRACGATFGWTYPQVEKLRALLTRGLLGLVTAYRLIDDEVDRTTRGVLEQLRPEIKEQFEKEIRAAGEHLSQFIDAYGVLRKRRQGPFAGCVHCVARCFYRAEVNTLLSAKDKQWINNELTNAAHATLEARYTAVAKAAVSIAQNWAGEQLGSPAGIHTRVIGFCASLHTIASMGFSEYEQSIAGNRLEQHLLNVEKKNV